MSDGLDGRVAVVTGGAGGIGRTVCRHFAERGARVTVADLAADRAAETAAECDRQHAIGVQIDVVDPASAAECVAATVERFGRVDFLVHCAGNNIKGPALELSLEDWRSQLDTHLTGAFVFCQAVGRRLVAQGEGGRIVLLSSVAAWAPIPQRGAYSPSKAGLVSLAQVLSVEWAEHRINVNAVCPGVAKTPMTDMVYSRDPELKRTRRNRMPIPREVLPEEIADLVVFLCGAGSAYINGAAIPIDGGFLNSGFMPERNLDETS
ncbi:MAG: SDR family NAD(P)-dependent oxidoreductase [Spirochaetaceae bacterium]|nr:SDR family NAD(P)-dependent oxidoreductase [Spirochaetaceae bacterium]